jgi:hypothetical protein
MIVLLSLKMRTRPETDLGVDLLATLIFYQSIANECLILLKQEVITKVRKNVRTLLRPAVRYERRLAFVRAILGGVVKELLVSGRSIEEGNEI